MPTDSTNSSARLDQFNVVQIELDFLMMASERRMLSKL